MSVITLPNLCRRTSTKTRVNIKRNFKCSLGALRSRANQILVEIESKIKGGEGGDKNYKIFKQKNEIYYKMNL